MSVVSERMSSQSCSVSPSCNCLFIVYSITAVCCVFVHAEEIAVHICTCLTGLSEDIVARKISVLLFDDWCLPVC